MRYRSVSCNSEMKNPPYIFRIVFITAILPLSLYFPGLRANASPAMWGYYMEGSFRLKGGDADLRERLAGYEVVCHTGYVLDRRGKLVRMPRDRSELRGLLHSTATYVPMITLRSAAEGRAMLASAGARAFAAKELATLLKTGHLTALHLDFEYLPPSNAPRLAEFLKTLRALCKGAHISMAVFPQIEFPRERAGFHDLAIIGPHLDEIVLMCYDLHRPGTSPGPVTDIGWSERNIAHALKHLNQKQIWLGVPAYGYSWDASGRAAAISARSGVREAVRCSAVRHSSGTLYYECAGAHGTRRAWIADRHTRALLEELAAKYGLRGTALWRLGFEE